MIFLPGHNPSVPRSALARPTGYRGINRGNQKKNFKVVLRLPFTLCSVDSCPLPAEKLPYLVYSQPAGGSLLQSNRLEGRWPSTTNMIFGYHSVKITRLGKLCFRLFLIYYRSSTQRHKFGSILTEESLPVLLVFFKNSRNGNFLSITPTKQELILPLKYSQILQHSICNAHENLFT